MPTKDNVAPAEFANGVYSAAWDSLFRITVKQYHDMIDNGILSPDDRVELLEGLLVRKMPTNPPHSLVKGLLSDLLAAMVVRGFFVREQDPTTTEDSEPEPDISVIRGTRRGFDHRHPTAADTVLLVEVSDTSVQRDRQKKRIYARASFPVYWIVNIPERQIEVYEQPSGPSAEPNYAKVTIYKDGENVPVVIDDDVRGHIAVTDVLP